MLQNELNIDIDLLKNGEIATLFKLNCEWLNKLIKVKDIASLEQIINIVPQSIKVELEKLLLTAKSKLYKYNNCTTLLWLTEIL